MQQERAELENRLIEICRVAYPELANFKTILNQITNIHRKKIQLYDAHNCIPKTIVLRLLNYLDLRDILNLSYTCHGFHFIISSMDYNQYWETRFHREFPYCPIKDTSCASASASASDSHSVFHFNYKQYRKLRKDFDVLWFDAYQYVSQKLHFKRCNGNKRKFRTWYIYKYKLGFPKLLLAIDPSLKGLLKHLTSRVKFKIEADPKLLEILGINPQQALTPVQSRKYVYSFLMQRLGNERLQEIGKWSKDHLKLLFPKPVQQSERLILTRRELAIIKNVKLEQSQHDGQRKVRTLGWVIVDILRKRILKGVYDEIQNIVKQWNQTYYDTSLYQVDKCCDELKISWLYRPPEDSVDFPYLIENL